MDTYILTLEKRDEFFRTATSVRVAIQPAVLEANKGAGWLIGNHARRMLHAILIAQGYPHPDV